MTRFFLLIIVFLGYNQLFSQTEPVFRSAPSVTAPTLDANFECYGVDSGCVSLDTFPNTICYNSNWSFDSPNPPSICAMDAYLDNVTAYDAQIAYQNTIEPGDVFCSLTKVIETDTLLVDQNIDQNLIGYITGLHDYRMELNLRIANFGNVEGYTGDFSVNVSVTIGEQVFIVPVPAFNPEGVRWFPVSIPFCRRNENTIAQLKIAVEIENPGEKSSCIVGIDALTFKTRNTGECPPFICPDCSSLDLMPNKKYIVSGWVKQTDSDYAERSGLATYSNCSIDIVHQDEYGYVISSVSAVPQGEIIDGWQRMSAEFITPEAQTGSDPVTIDMKIRLNNNSGNYAFFDDIRIHPIDGNLKSFVYDQQSQKLLAELDENNYATFYEYDKEGGLVRVKKETEKGIFTIQETRSSTKKTAP